MMGSPGILALTPCIFSGIICFFFGFVWLETMSRVFSTLASFGLSIFMAELGAQPGKE